jgi:trans-aconitate 2-methyltransferase
MLAEAVRHERAGLSFRLGDAGEIGVGEDVVPGGGPERGDGAGWDLVFANASLQWVPDHAGLLPRLRQALAPGGQLAFQVPANSDHPSHLVASEVAAEAPFAAALAPCPPDPAASVLPAEEYAEILDRLGVADQHVRLQVYGHHLDSQDAVVEWVSGTLLTRYRSKLDPASYDAYLARYRARLSERLGPSRPYFYAYKRILVWARFP